MSSVLSPRFNRDISRIMNEDKVVEDTEGIDKLGLKFNRVIGSCFCDSKPALEDTKCSLNDIACLSMPEIIQLFIVCRPETKVYEY